MNNWVTSRRVYRQTYGQTDLAKRLSSSRWTFMDIIIYRASDFFCCVSQIKHNFNLDNWMYEKFSILLPLNHIQLHNLRMRLTFLVEHLSRFINIYNAISSTHTKSWRNTTEKLHFQFIWIAVVMRHKVCSTFLQTSTKTMKFLHKCNSNKYSQRQMRCS